jgi:hypothetical protein
MNNVVKKEFRIQKNSYVSDGVGTNYAFTKQFVIRINWVGFPCNDDDLSFIIIKFHTVSSTSTEDGINARQ